MKKCDVAWCDKSVAARGLCSTHYDRWNRGRDPHTKSAHELTPEERFWPKVKKGSNDECWAWQAGADSRGYGHFKVRGRMVMAHRFSYELVSGPIPEGMYVCHSCDNPNCVNPEHLWLGSCLDNIRDCVNKGRKVISPKIDKDIADAIRRRYVPGEFSQDRVAREFGISQSQVSNIILGYQWN
jgi:hypothetical protein